jgi:hypothetical protein
MPQVKVIQEALVLKEPRDSHSKLEIHNSKKEDRMRLIRKRACPRKIVIPVLEYFMI